MISITRIKGLLDRAHDHTLSLYLNVNPAERENQARTPAWRIELKNALTALEADMKSTDKAAWDHIRVRMEQFLEDYTVSSKALALFFSPEYEEVYELPLPIEHQYSFGKPMIAPLMWAIDEYERYLILLVDQEKAHFVTAYLGSASMSDTMTLEIDTDDWRERTQVPARSGGQTTTQGSHIENVIDRVEEQQERFHREVAQRAQALVEEEGIDRIVLGGSEDSAHAVRSMMHDKTAQQVIAILPIPLRAAPHEILEHALPAALNYERDFEKELVSQVIDMAKSGGRGALGRDDVLQAIDERRVELLITPHTLDDETLRTDLPIRMLEAGSTLEMVHGEAAEMLQSEGGLAARLYYVVAQPQ